MDKEIIMNLIVKRVLAGETIINVLADFNITNKSLGLYKCETCGQVINDENDDIANLMEGAFHSHYQCLGLF